MEAPSVAAPKHHHLHHNHHQAVQCSGHSLKYQCCIHTLLCKLDHIIWVQTRFAKYENAKSINTELGTKYEIATWCGSHN